MNSRKLWWLKSSPATGYGLVAVLLLSISVCGAVAQSSTADRRRAIELKYADGLTRLGLFEYAQEVLARLGGGAEVEVRRLKGMLSSGQHAEVRQIIARRPDQASKSTWEMKLALADSLFAWGEQQETIGIHKAFFARCGTAVPNDFKDLHLETSYKHTQMLLLMGKKKAAAEAYAQVIGSNPPNHVKRQMMSERAQVLLELAEESDGNERETYLTEIEKVCDEIFWQQDVWFGKAVVMLAHIRMMRGDTDGAMALVDEHRERLSSIDKLLKEQGLLHLSPMAECRYLVGVILHDEAVRLLASGGDRKQILVLLTGKEKALGAKKTPGAIQHFINVFVRYPSTAWAADAGRRAKLVEELLGKQLDKKIKFEVTPEMWEAVMKAQLQRARTLYNQQLFTEAAESYLAILNLFPESERSVAALTDLAICYIETDNDLYAETVIYYIAERFNKSRDTIVAGDQVLRLGDMYGERKRPDKKAWVYDVFFDHFREHPRAAGLLYRAGERLFNAGDISGAQAYYERIKRDYRHSPLYLDAMGKIAYCYARQEDRKAERDALAEYVGELEKEERPGHALVSATYRLAAANLHLGGKNLVSAIKQYSALIKRLSEGREQYQSNQTEKERNLEILEGAMFQRAYCYTKLPAPKSKPPLYYKVQAIKAYNALLAKFPASETSTPKALNQIGTLWTILEKPDKAQEALHRLKADFPESPEARNALFLLAKSLLDMGMRKKAVPIFKEMFEGTTEYSSIKILTAGKELLKAKEYEISIQAFDRVLDSARERALMEPALFGKGVAHVKLGQFVEATKTLEELFGRYAGTGHTVDAAFHLSWAYSDLAMKEADADKRFDVFNSAVLAIKRARKYAKTATEKLQLDMEVGRIAERKSRAEATFGGDQARIAEYQNAAIASYETIILIQNPGDAEARPHLEAAYAACLPLLVEVERWDVLVDDCEKYLQDFKNGKSRVKARGWLNKARAELAIQGEAGLKKQTTGAGGM